LISSVSPARTFDVTSHLALENGYSSSILKAAHRCFSILCVQQCGNRCVCVCVCVCVSTINYQRPERKKILSLSPHIIIHSFLYSLYLYSWFVNIYDVCVC